MTQLQRLVGALCGVAIMGACGLSTLSDKSGLEGLCSNGQIGQAINSTGPVPAGCTKIEGGDVRNAPQVIAFQGGTVTITSYQYKSDSPGDSIGFEFTSTAPVAFAVKAGGSTYVATSSPWVHPAGTSGPEASGISNITFCPLEGADGGVTETPGTPGDTTECTPGLPGGSPCTQNSECASDSCVAGICENTGGGSGLPGGSACNDNSDCASDSCKDGVCEAGNGGGGLPNGSTCANASDCASGACVAGVCEEAGGGSGLPNGSTCAGGSDCASGNCVGGICEEAGAGNGLPDGSACGASSDCASGSCVNGICEAGGGSSNLPPGSACTSNSQCLSGSCTNAICEGSGVGEPCTQTSDCAAQLSCVQNVCQSSTIN